MRTTTIPVVSGWAEGPTPLAAFDAALTVGGVGDVNLVALSSIVPPQHIVTVTSPADLAHTLSMGFGDLAFCIVAEERAVSGSTAAGLAWALDSDLRGGVFLEAHGRDPRAVQLELEAGIEDLMGRRSFLNFDPPEFLYASGSSEGPSSAVVVAVVETRPFHTR